MSRRRLIAAAVGALAVAAPAHAAALPAPARCDGCATFRPTTTPWQIQLQGTPRTDLPAPAIEIDGFEARRRTVRRIERGRRRSICYINAGAWESYRPDREDFAAVLLGAVCRESRRRRFSTIFKRVSLRAYRRTC